MYHSINFKKEYELNSEKKIRNTWNSWHMVAKSRPSIDPPKVKTRFVDIPGANGSLDLTEGLLGHPVYENMTGTIDFIIVNSNCYTGPDRDKLNDNLDIVWGDPYSINGNWYDVYKEISSYLNGKRMQMYLEDDPTTIFTGRFSVHNYKSEESYATISVDYNLDPWVDKYFYNYSQKTGPHFGKHVDFFYYKVLEHNRNPLIVRLNDKGQYVNDFHLVITDKKNNVEVLNTVAPVNYDYKIMMVTEQDNLLSPNGFHDGSYKNNNGIEFETIENGTAVSIKGSTTNASAFYTLYDSSDGWSIPILDPMYFQWLPDNVTGDDVQIQIDSVIPGVTGYSNTLTSDTLLDFNEWKNRIINSIRIQIPAGVSNLRTVIRPALTHGESYNNIDPPKKEFMDLKKTADSIIYINRWHDYDIYIEQNDKLTVQGYIFKIDIFLKQREIYLERSDKDV